MSEAIFMAIIGPLVTVLGVAININAGLSPGGEGGRMVGGALFLCGLWVFAAGVAGWLL